MRKKKEELISFKNPEWSDIYIFSWEDSSLRSEWQTSSVSKKWCHQNYKEPC
jgi:hypothetical protein